MSFGAPGAARVDRETGTEAAVEIEVDGRWDALALSEALVPFRSFLVQDAGERWVVHARAPGCHGEPLGDALRAIERWQSDRRVDALVRVADGKGNGKETRWNA